jgi:hypothetical protein
MPRQAKQGLKVPRKEMVAAADRAARPQPRRRSARLKHFEKALESPYPFH